MLPPLRIDKMLYGGDAVAHVEGNAPRLSVMPFVLPGELVTQRDKHTLQEIIEPSSDRTAPGCTHFGSCGGCHYQHASYPAQLAIKKAILKEIFKGAGLADLPVIELHSAEPWHYRNRVRLRVGEVDGELRVGYNRHDANGGDPLLPIVMCPIAAPTLWHAASALLQLAKAEPTVRHWLSAAVELELFTNADESALQLTLFTRNPPSAGFDSFCRLAQKAVPQLTGAGVAILPKRPSPQGRRFEHARPGPQWGSAGLMYQVDDTSLWVSRGAFFQANRSLVSTLTRLATANRSGMLAWDLYAGVGLFSRALTQSFEQVIAVEAGQPAATDLQAALKGKTHRAFAATALDFLQAAVVQRERPELIVMDPPRAGIGPEVCALLARIACEHLVYVSCDPLTLARDLRQLVDGGYTLAALHLVDMFPQTFHMETVAMLQR